MCGAKRCVCAKRGRGQGGRHGEEPTHSKGRGQGKGVGGMAGMDKGRGQQTGPCKKCVKREKGK